MKKSICSINGVESSLEGVGLEEESNDSIARRDAATVSNSSNTIDNISKSLSSLHHCLDSSTIAFQMIVGERVENIEYYVTVYILFCYGKN